MCVCVCVCVSKPGAFVVSNRTSMMLVMLVTVWLSPFLVRELLRRTDPGGAVIRIWVRTLLEPGRVLVNLVVWTWSLLAGVSVTRRTALARVVLVRIAVMAARRAVDWRPSGRRWVHV